MPVDSALLRGVLDDLNRTRAIWAAAGDGVDAHTGAAATKLAGMLDGLAEAAPAQLVYEVHLHALQLRMAYQATWPEVRATIDRQANSVRATIGAATCLSPSWRLMCSAVLSPTARDPLARELPGTDATVEDINGWWKGLDVDEKRDTLSRHSSYLGRVDGIPIPVRDGCNRPELDVAITKTTMEIERIMELSPRRRLPLRPKLHRERSKLAGLQTIRQRIARLEAQGREVYLVDLDTEGTGTATIAINNPDTSDRVITYLPGGGTTLAKAGGCLDDSTNLLQMIERLDAGDEPLPTTSMITRIYPVPELAPGVLLSDHAVDEASRFCRFQHGLHVTHAPPATPDDQAFFGIVTHSYGGVTAITTDLLFGAEADVLSVNGPPGGVTDNADQLSIPTMFATGKRHDLLVALSRARIIHNRQPMDPKYKARVFTSDPGKRWRLPGVRWSIAAHFDYFGTDLLSLYNNAQVCRGHEPIPAVDAILDA